jgi:DNA-binding MarR family transcriptional regulator
MWDLVSFAQGRSRRSCLEGLGDGAKTPQMIAKATNSYLTHISRAMRELEKKGLVRCLTPEMNKNRFYELTDTGREVLGKL